MMPAYDELPVLLMMVPGIVSAVLTFDAPLRSTFEDYYNIVYRATILYRGDASVHCREMLRCVSDGIAMAVKSYNGTDEALMMFQVTVWVCRYYLARYYLACTLQGLAFRVCKCSAALQCRPCHWQALALGKPCQGGLGTWQVPCWPRPV